MQHSPDLAPAAIRAAHATIHPAFRESPQYVHDGLTALAGAPVITVTVGVPGRARRWSAVVCPARIG